MHLFLRSAQLLSSHSRFILSNHARLFVNSGSRFVSIHQQPLLFQTIPLGSFSQICCRSWSFYVVRGFHTSQPRSAAPLAVLLVKLAGPLSKLTKLVAASVYPSFYSSFLSSVISDYLSVTTSRKRHGQT